MVTLVTYCCPKDIERTYAPGALSSLVASHQYPFSEVILIRQRCRDIDVGEPEIACRVLEAEDYPNIRAEFGIREENVEADIHARPPTFFEEKTYYWKYHCWNQLIGIKEAKTRYVVLTDCDVVIEGEPWVERAIEALKDPTNLCAAPGHGQPSHQSHVGSQITILFERERFMKLDYEVPLPLGEQLGMFHFVFEGRLQRYMNAHKVYRYMLGGSTIKHYAW